MAELSVLPVFFELTGKRVVVALSALLERRKSISCRQPPARQILLRVKQTPVDATMSGRGEALFRRIEDPFGEFAPN
jgi:hypothetical protein